MSQRDDYKPSVNYGKILEDTTWGHTPDPSEPKYRRTIGERFMEDTTTAQKVGILSVATVLLASAGIVKHLKKKKDLSPAALTILMNLDAGRQWNAETYQMVKSDALALRKGRLDLLNDGYVTSDCIGLTDKGQRALQEFQQRAKELFISSST